MSLIKRFSGEHNVTYRLSSVSCSVVTNSETPKTVCRLPGSSVHGTLQARILEWVPFSSPGDLPDPGMESASRALAGSFFTTEPPYTKSLLHHYSEYTISH